MVQQGISMLLPLRTISVPLSSMFWELFEKLTLHLPDKNIPHHGHCYHPHRKNGGVPTFGKPDLHTMKQWHASFWYKFYPLSTELSTRLKSLLHSCSAFSVLMESTTARHHPACISSVPMPCVMHVGTVLSFKTVTCLIHSTMLLCLVKYSSRKL